MVEQVPHLTAYRTHFFPKFWLKKLPCVLHGVGKVRIFPESDLIKWGASYMPVHPICRQIRYIQFEHCLTKNFSAA